MTLRRHANVATLLTALALLLPTSPASASADALGAGTVSGTLIDSDGRPVDNVGVSVIRVDQMWSTSSSTGEDGAFRIVDVPAGDYKVGFTTRSMDRQYAYQKESFWAADTIVVRDATETVVNNQLLPLGTLTVTAIDAVTGEAVAAFCARAVGWGVHVLCGNNGSVVFSSLAPGTYTVTVTPTGTHYPATVSDVAVLRGQTTSVAGTVTPGAAIRTTVVDAQTNQPVANTCVRAFSTHTPGVERPGYDHCTDATGMVTVGPLKAGTYMLLADPSDNVHGMQWVGWHGGTGDQLAARRISAQVGEVTIVPPVRLDPAGAVTGTVRDAATGSPVGGVCVQPYAREAFRGDATGSQCSNIAGQYTIGGLGPYMWPLQFADSVPGRYAWEWSGGAVDRYGAHRISVPADGTANADALLDPGGVIAGEIRNAAGDPIFANVYVFSARTGDYAASQTSTGGAGGDATYRVTSLHTQDVKIEYGLDKAYWYQDAVDFASATPVACTAGQTVTIDLRAD